MEILNTYQKTPTGTVVVLMLVLLMTIFLFAVGYAYLASMTNLKEGLLGLLACIFSFICFTGLMVGIVNDQFVNTYVEVKLNDRYPVNELYGKYEIKDVRGHIYILEEKELKEDIVEDNYG